MRVVVLVSGRGSNLKALIEYQQQIKPQFSIIAVISDKAQAPALNIAQDHNIPTLVVEQASDQSRDEWDRDLLSALNKQQPDLIVLAGFMRIVPKQIVQAFAGKMINVHPSLLPKYPGLNAPTQALEARAKHTGCTVHWVDELVDHGEILAQAALTIDPSDTPASLHARIQELEHYLLPRVLHSLAQKEG